MLDITLKEDVMILLWDFVVGIIVGYGVVDALPVEYNVGILVDVTITS